MKKNLIKYMLIVSILLCFLSAIWSRDKVQWVLTGFYAYAVTRFLVGNIFDGTVVGEEIQRDKSTIQYTNMVGRK